MAQTNRLLVIEAASRLFLERGYEATSIDEIAEAAGVSRATVFSTVGGKPALLKTAFDVAVVGDDQPISLSERPRSRAARQEPDPDRYLALYAEILTEVGGRLAPIHEVVRSAAGADSDARYLWENHRAQRRQAADGVVRQVRETGGRLREGLDTEAAADIVWVLNDPGLYHQLVNERRWKPERFQRWLADTLRRQLLPDPAAPQLAERPTPEQPRPEPASPRPSRRG
ncbi:MAG TPA: helix-turn-helix domain-containing protein [Candidatus Dormibacteraeota bacterium]